MGLEKRSIIVRIDGKYQVRSEKGKNLGTCDTLEEASKRLRQFEHFKYKDEDKKRDKKAEDKASVILRELAKMAAKRQKIAYKKKWQEEFREKAKQEAALARGDQEPEQEPEQESEYGSLTESIINSYQHRTQYRTKSKIRFRSGDKDYVVGLFGANNQSLLNQPAIDVSVWENDRIIDPAKIMPILSGYALVKEPQGRQNVPTGVLFKELTELLEIADAVFQNGSWVKPQPQPNYKGSVAQYLSTIPRMSNGQWFVIPLIAPSGSENIAVCVQGGLYGECEPKEILEKITDYTSVQISIESYNGTRPTSPYFDIPTDGNSPIDSFKTDKFSAPGKYLYVPVPALIKAIEQLLGLGYTLQTQKSALTSAFYELTKTAYKKKWQEQQREKARQEAAQKPSEQPSGIPTWEEQWEAYMAESEEPSEQNVLQPVATQPQASRAYQLLSNAKRASSFGYNPDYFFAEIVIGDLKVRLFMGGHVSQTVPSEKLDKLTDYESVNFIIQGPSGELDPKTIDVIKASGATNIINFMLEPWYFFAKGVKMDNLISAVDAILNYANVYSRSELGDRLLNLCKKNYEFADAVYAYFDYGGKKLKIELHSGYGYSSPGSDRYENWNDYDSISLSFSLEDEDGRVADNAAALELAYEICPPLRHFDTGGGKHWKPVLNVPIALVKQLFESIADKLGASFVEAITY